MIVAQNVLEAIGRTPLIRLNHASALTGCDIYGKAEFMNPGQSVKDRAALYIVRDAQATGRLKPGGRIVEGTAGNTGIGLALVAKALGYSCTIVIPSNQSDEKKDAIRLYGADLVEVAPAPYSNEMNYQHVSRRLAAELDAREPAGAVWANQFDNTANRDAHVHGTGPEIWEQTEGKVDGFICAIGSGGTLSGVAEALRERNAGVQIGLADPHGASLYSYYTEGELKSEGTSITEGIGQGRITANIEGLTIDRPYRISDEDLLLTLYDLVEHEGLILGGSSGVNVAGAIRMARDLGPGKTIVTILCDSGQRYQSKIYNPLFLREQGLPIPGWLS
jgi:cysteine synthase A